MKNAYIVSLLLSCMLMGQVATAQSKGLEEILQAKGVITADEYREAIQKNDRAYYKKGLVVESRDGNYKAKVGGYAQMIYRNTAVDDKTKSNKSDFDIRRFKLQLKGYLLNKKFGYKYQGEMASGFKTEDAYVNYKFNPALIIQVGQYKPPQARQELTSASKQLFPDRSMANDTFNLGRDQGLQIAGGFADKLVQYRLGIFNGNGPLAKNPDDNHMYTGRIDINPLGSYKMDEAAWTSDKLLVNLGASFARNKITVLNVEGSGKFNKDNDVMDKALGLDDLAAGDFTTNYGSDLTWLLWTTNLNARWQGITFAAEYYSLNANPAKGADWDADGYYAQIGYQLIPKRLELGLRRAAIKSTDAVASAKYDKKETQFGVNYYFAKHSLKLQSDITWVEDDLNTGKDDTLFRLQAQFSY
ncbi:MAG: OprO/OprP family phosphate-selective porin [Geopsychrobacter sp.]|nr:OprO/OprP family phosphate-selective porin [Geopsychrobacter sp.]